MTNTTAPAARKSAVRKVAAVDPNTGTVYTRGSKTMTYTHALVMHFNARPEYTIPAGTYTEPATRIRGRNIPAYTFTRQADQTFTADEASTAVISFHQGREAADKAGRAYVSNCASQLEVSRSIFGDLVPNIPLASRYQIVEVEVI